MPNIPLIRKAIEDIEATPLDQICSGSIFDGKKCCAVGLMLKTAGETLLPNPALNKSWKFPEDLSTYDRALLAYINQYKLFDEHYGLHPDVIVSINDDSRKIAPNIDGVIEYLQLVVEQAYADKPYMKPELKC